MAVQSVPRMTGMWWEFSTAEGFGKGDDTVVRGNIPQEDK